MTISTNPIKKEELVYIDFAIMEKPRGLPSEPHSGDQASWELAIMNEVNSMRSPTDITQFRHDQLQSISCRAVQVRGKVNAFVFFATTAWNVDNTLVGSGKASRLNWDEVWMLSGLHDVQKYQLHAFGTEPARQTVRNGGGTEAQRVGPIGNFTDVNMQHVMGASRFWAALYLKTYGRPEKVTEWLKERPSILMFIYCKLLFLGVLVSAAHISCVSHDYLLSFNSIC